VEKGGGFNMFQNLVVSKIFYIYLYLFHSARPRVGSGALRGKHECYFPFHNYMGYIILPIDFHIFQGGRSTTKQFWEILGDFGMMVLPDLPGLIGLLTASRSSLFEIAAKTLGDSSKDSGTVSGTGRDRSAELGDVPN
jgi:hypothetical protein